MMTLLASQQLSYNIHLFIASWCHLFAIFTWWCHCMVNQILLKLQYSGTYLF